MPNPTRLYAERIKQLWAENNTMAMKTAFALAFLPVAMLACGGSAKSAAPATTAATQPAPAIVTTTTTTGAVKMSAASEVSTVTAPEDGRAKVKLILETHYQDNKALLDELGTSLGTDFSAIDDASVDKAIADACKAKASGFQIDPQSVGVIGMMAGQVLVRHGTDAASFMKDATDVNREIAEAVGCP